MQESRLPDPEEEKVIQKEEKQKKQMTKEEEEKINFSLQTEQDIEDKRKYVLEEFSKVTKTLSITILIF